MPLPDFICTKKKKKKKDLLNLVFLKFVKIIYFNFLIS